MTAGPVSGEPPDRVEDSASTRLPSPAPQDDGPADEDGDDAEVDGFVPL